jgi:hypothetical protein
MARPSGGRLGLIFLWGLAVEVFAPRGTLFAPLPAHHTEDECTPPVVRYPHLRYLSGLALAGNLVLSFGWLSHHTPFEHAWFLTSCAILCAVQVWHVPALELPWGVFDGLSFLHGASEHALAHKVLGGSATSPLMVALAGAGPVRAIPAGVLRVRGGRAYHARACPPGGAHHDGPVSWHVPPPRAPCGGRLGRGFRSVEPAPGERADRNDHLPHHGGARPCAARWVTPYERYLLPPPYQVSTVGRSHLSPGFRFKSGLGRMPRNRERGWSP